MQFQFTRSLQSVTSATLFHPPYLSLRKGCPTTNLQLSLQRTTFTSAAQKLCFPLHVTTVTAVNWQICSQIATNSSFSTSVCISALTSENLVPWQSALPPRDKDRLEGENNSKILDNV